VDVRLGSPISAAGLLGVVDRHLPDVPRQRVGQLPGGVRDAEDGVSERGALARSGEVRGEDGRQAIDYDLLRRSDGRGDVRRLGRHHAGAGDGGDLGRDSEWPGGSRRVLRFCALTAKPIQDNHLVR